MLVIYFSPLYLRCGIIISESESLRQELELYKSKFLFINSELIFDYNSNTIILFQISTFKIEEFTTSPDYEFLKKMNLISEINIEEREKRLIEETLLLHKDSNEIMNEPIIKSQGISSCYYCGILTGRNEYLIYKLFHKKCEKFGDSVQLSISGIDFINSTLQNPFFNLPKGTISEHVIIKRKNDKDSKLTKDKKNKITYKDNLYPYLLSSGEEGVTIYQVDSVNSYKKLGHNNLGPTSLWSLFNLSCNYEDMELALEEAAQGSNELIDLSVGDIYGGDYEDISLCTDIIASSFSKLANINSIGDIDKKDIGRALLIFYGFNYAQIASMFPSEKNIDKTIFSGDTYNSLELKHIIQVCLEGLSTLNGHPMGCAFSDYSNYFEIIGMIKELEKSGLLKI